LEALKEDDLSKRFDKIAKAESIERALIDQNEFLTFSEFVNRQDENYNDRVFWIEENSKNETSETIRKWTLGYRLRFEKRLNKKLRDDKARSRKRSDT